MPHFFGALLTASPEPELIEGNLLKGIDKKPLEEREFQFVYMCFLLPHPNLCATKPDFGIGNQNQDPISVLVLMNGAEFFFPKTETFFVQKFSNVVFAPVQITALGEVY